MSKQPKITSVKFPREGILVVYSDGRKELIGDPINVTAFGTGIQDGAAYTVVEYRDRDAQWRIAAVPSSLLRRLRTITATITAGVA
jgi:hypothetical protein